MDTYNNSFPIVCWRSGEILYPSFDKNVHHITITIRPETSLHKIYNNREYMKGNNNLPPIKKRHTCIDILSRASLEDQY